MNNLFLICSGFAGLFFLLATYSNVEAERNLRPGIAKWVIMIMSLLTKVVGAILVVGSYYYLCT